MKKVPLLPFLIVCVVIAVGAYFSYPLISGWIAGRELEKIEAASSAADSSAQGELVISMSAAKATELLNASADENFPLEDIEVAFGSGVIVMSGVAQRDALIPDSMLSQYPNLQVIKKFIPESASVGVSFGAAVVDGGLKITPQSFTIEGYNLPLGFLPAEVRDSVGELICERFVPEDLKLSSVVVEDGRITVSVE